MIVSTEGIVLKQIPFSESSIICKIYTRDFGLLSFLVRGAKSSKKASKGSSLRPMNKVYLSFYNKESKGLKSITEHTLLFSPDAKIYGVHRSAVAMLMTEVLNQTITEESIPDEIKYDFIVSSFDYLKEHPLTNYFYLSFLFQYVDYLGFAIPENISNQYYHLLSSYQISDEIISKSERKALFNTIQFHYQENITNFKSLKSISILEEILQE